MKGWRFWNFCFENPFTIRPVINIMWIFCVCFFFCFYTILVPHKWLGPDVSDQLEVASHSSRINFPFLHIALPLLSHDKGYFPCCVCTNEIMWMWFTILGCLFSLWTTTQYIFPQCWTIYSSLLLTCPVTFTYERVLSNINVPLTFGVFILIE